MNFRLFSSMFALMADIVLVLLAMPCYAHEFNDFSPTEMHLCIDSRTPVIVACSAGKSSSLLVMDGYQVYNNSVHVVFDPSDWTRNETTHPARRLFDVDRIISSDRFVLRKSPACPWMCKKMYSHSGQDRTNERERETAADAVRTQKNK